LTNELEPVLVHYFQSFEEILAPLTNRPLEPGPLVNAEALAIPVQEAR
jgi:hypothetical protein